MPISEKFLLENNFLLTPKGRYILEFPSPLQGIKVFVEVWDLGDTRNSTH
jgi:hypothetical protein